MSTTYLQAVNDILTETNEVQLTSSNFAGAVGVQAFVKNAVNRAYLELCNSNKEWPFLAAASGNINDPYAGNLSQEVSEGIRWYLLKPGSTTVNTDYGRIDWDSFFLTTEGVVGATEPYEYQNLEFTTFDDWVDRFRESESRDAGDTQQYDIPKRVIVSQDGRYFGLSPIPDQTYKVYFSAWVRATRLVTHSEELLIPDEYTPVLYHRARYYVHQFKENEIQANMASNDYRRGENKMSIDLTGTNMAYMRDDRIGEY